MPSTIKNTIIRIIEKVLFSIFSVFSLKNKVVATTMRGRKFSDNSMSIVVRVHEISPDTEIVWLVNPNYSFDVPSWVKKVQYYGNRISLIYNLSTAKVWINTHRFESNWKKRKGQLVIETWHGGLGIKKIEKDIPQVLSSKFDLDEIENTCKLSDVFISQSEHLSQIYRRAFDYKGVIFKCGYPKNDVFFKENDDIKQKVHRNLDTDNKLVLYAPTFRDNDQAGDINLEPYLWEFQEVLDAVRKRFGGEWTFLIKWHPVMIPYVKKLTYPSNVIDATSYPDIQELLLTADVVISDYSSCLFDAMLREIPCFIYATDFEKYKSDRGTYFSLDELPFSSATSVAQLIEIILTFSNSEYLDKLTRFKVKTGLVETGHAAEEIAERIVSFIHGNTIHWE